MTPSIYIVDHPGLVVSNIMVNFIDLKRVKKYRDNHFDANSIKSESLMCSNIERKEVMDTTILKTDILWCHITLIRYTVLYLNISRGSWPKLPLNTVCLFVVKKKNSNKIVELLDWNYLVTLLWEIFRNCPLKNPHLCMFSPNCFVDLIFHFALAGFAQTWKNLEGFLEKFLKIKSALKSTEKSLKSLEKSLNSTIFCRTKHSDIDLNHYKIVVPLFGAAYAAPNKGTTILY